MRGRSCIIIGRAADAAWIHDHRSVREPHEIDAVAVAAKHDPGLDGTEPFADRAGRASYEAAVFDLLDEVEIIARRRRMTGEDAGRDEARHRKLAQKHTLILGELAKGVTVRSPHLLGRELGDLPVVVAAHRERVELCKSLHGLARPQRARGAIAEID